MGFRTAVNAFTGLMFLAQGFALAAVVVPVPAAAAAPAQMADAMPCHHGQPSPASPSLPKCCDDGCIGMVACASAHVAVTSSSFVLASLPARLPALIEHATVLPPPRAVFHLRPPIALHA